MNWVFKLMDQKVKYGINIKPDHKRYYDLRHTMG